MKRLYSILKVSDSCTGQFNIVVCETLKDEEDIHRMARNANMPVTVMLNTQDASNGIFLNDFPVSVPC